MSHELSIFRLTMIKTVTLDSNYTHGTSRWKVSKDKLYYRAQYKITTLVFNNRHCVFVLFKGLNHLKAQDEH